MIQAAPFELAELACKVRPDWDRVAVDGAITACRSAGWSWPRTLTEFARLLTDAESAPRDLLNATRGPLERQQHPPVDAETRWELLAPARAAVAAASLTWAERQREREPDEAGGTVPGDDR